MKARRSILMRAVFGSTKSSQKNLARNAQDRAKGILPELLFTAQAASAIAAALKLPAETLERAKKKMLGEAAERETKAAPAPMFGKRPARAARNPLN